MSSTALRPSAIAAAAATALRTSVAVTLRSAGDVVQSPISPSAAGEPGAVYGSSAGVLNGDMVLPVPSAADRGIRSLGPVAISVCKRLVFKVSVDTDLEIIHTSSVFEAHGLICRFRGFWPSLPQLHTWISQCWEPIIKGSVNIFPSAKGFFIAKFEYVEDISKILGINPFSWEDKYVLMVKP
ncbi:hypothetical protein SUGI_0067310 [Cryptomeria japonica]|nr:hypothetical protein SUGI_0067310 [Cryptomeria japonica]